MGAGNVPEGCARRRWPLPASAYRRPRASRDSSERATAGPAAPLVLGSVAIDEGETRCSGTRRGATGDAIAASQFSPLPALLPSPEAVSCELDSEQLIPTVARHCPHHSSTPRTTPVCGLIITLTGAGRHHWWLSKP